MLLQRRFKRFAKMVTSGLSSPINQWEHDFQLQEIDNNDLLKW